MRAELDKLTSDDFAAGAAYYRSLPTIAGADPSGGKPSDIFEAGELARRAFYRALPSNELAAHLRRDEAAAADADAHARRERWKVRAFHAAAVMFVAIWVVAIARVIIGF